MEIELLSLSKPRSGEGDGNLGDCSLWSLLLLHPQPWKGHRGVCLSLGTSCADCSPGREALEVLNLKGCWAGGFTQGCPVLWLSLYDPIQLMLWPFYPLVMSWGQQ